MRPADCELVNEIYIEIREQLKELSGEDDSEKAVNISIVIDNLQRQQSILLAVGKWFMKTN